MVRGEWSKEWPTEEGSYWAYGSINANKPRMFLVEVRDDGRHYISLNGFLVKDYSKLVFTPCYKPSPPKDFNLKDFD